MITIIGKKERCKQQVQSKCPYNLTNSQPDQTKIQPACNINIFSAQYLLGIFLGMADGPELRSKPLGGADCPPQLEMEWNINITSDMLNNCEEIP